MVGSWRTGTPSDGRTLQRCPLAACTGGAVCGSVGRGTGGGRGDGTSRRQRPPLEETRESGQQSPS